MRVVLEDIDPIALICHGRCQCMHVHRCTWGCAMAPSLIVHWHAHVGGLTGTVVVILQ